MQWILRNYPTESVWQLKDFFEGKRHRIGGKEVSLDDIEKGTLILQIGCKDHAILVCAARRCPPLSCDAYAADKLDGQFDAAFTRWLARPDLNKFKPADNSIDIYNIFKWFKKDSTRWVGFRRFFRVTRRRTIESSVKNTNYTVNFKSYTLGLNDQGPHGRNYGTRQFLLDQIF